MTERLEIAAARSARLPDGKAPREILLLPAGTVATRAHDRREPWHNPDAAAVAAASGNLGELPIDYEHQGDRARENGQPAPAAGWIKRVFARDGAVFAEVEWTARAAAMIEAKEYRFLSPVFEFDKKSRRVKRVVAAALTNNPALVALANYALASGPDAGRHGGTMDTKAIARALGLAETATEDEINTAAANAEAKRAEDAVDAGIAAGKIAPAQRETALGLAAREPDTFTAFLDAAPVAAVFKRATFPSVAAARAPSATPDIPDDYTVDPEGVALTERALARAKAENVAFAVALRAEARNA